MRDVRGFVSTIALALAFVSAPYCGNIAGAQTEAVAKGCFGVGSEAGAPIPISALDIECAERAVEAAQTLDVDLHLLRAACREVQRSELREDFAWALIAHGEWESATQALESLVQSRVSLRALDLLDLIHGGDWVAARALDHPVAACLAGWRLKQMSEKGISVKMAKTLRMKAAAVFRISAESGNAYSLRELQYLDRQSYFDVLRDRGFEPLR